jgi:hypothetical protein
MRFSLDLSERSPYIAFDLELRHVTHTFFDSLAALGRINVVI